jgi:hypothetical protein
MLAYDPEERPSAEQLLRTSVFFEGDEPARLVGSESVMRRVTQLVHTRVTTRTPLFTEEECLVIHNKERRFALLRVAELAYYDAELYEMDSHKEKLKFFKKKSNGQTPGYLRVMEFEGANAMTTILSDYHNQHCLLDYLRSREHPCN